MLGQVGPDNDDDLVVQQGRPADDVEVPVGHRIERAGASNTAHAQTVLPSGPLIRHRPALARPAGVLITSAGYPPRSPLSACGETVPERRFAVSAGPVGGITRRPGNGPRTAGALDRKERARRQPPVLEQP